MRKRTLSTGDIARYCQVTPATIVNWIHAKKLIVYTTPGGQYRMELTKFLDFLRANGFPLPDELASNRALRVLAIDDDEPTLAMLRDAISTAAVPCDIRTASNGYDGLIMVGEFKPDVIILDLRMPTMDGVEMLRRLRANAETRNIRVVVATGLGMTSAAVRKVKRAGVEGLLAKPVDVKRLLALLGEFASAPAR